MKVLGDRSFERDVKKLPQAVQVKINPQSNLSFNLQVFPHFR